MAEKEKTLNFPPEYIQVLAHYYRAEVYRSSVWRTRLDVTTNWAILAMTAAFSWSFTASNPDSHVVFPITSCIVLLLLFIETRRFRFFDLWQTRARLLEGHLIVPALNPELKLIQGNWREFLSNDLLLPRFKISFWEAFARRLAGVYIYIFLLLFVGWFVRVYTSADFNADESVNFEEFLRACRYKFVSPWLTLSFGFGFTAGISALLYVNWHGRKITGEIRRRDPKAPSWPV